MTGSQHPDPTCDPSPQVLSQSLEGRVKGMGQLPCREVLRGTSVMFPQAPPSSQSPGGGENLGILLSLPSRMRPVLCPHQGFQAP